MDGVAVAQHCGGVGSGSGNLVLILDYGSQYTHLITRRIRQLSVLSLCVSGTSPLHAIAEHRPRVVILSGGPHSVHATGAPSFPEGFLRYAEENGVFVLGICYGMQLIVQKLGGEVRVGEEQEYGKMEITVEKEGGMFRPEEVGESQAVWMSHGDEAVRLPEGFSVVARSRQGAVAAVAQTGQYPQLRRTSQRSTLSLSLVTSPSSFLFPLLRLLSTHIQREREREREREKEKEREMAMASASVPAAGASLMASSASSSPSSTALRRPHAKAVFFRLVPNPRLRLVSTSSMVSRLNLTARRSCVLVVSSQMNEVVGEPSNDAAAVERKPEVPIAPNGAVEAPSAPMSQEAMSEFMTEVASLVKLVDSRDIIELQLKQQDCELVIRKKEAFPQPPAPAPGIMMQPHGLPSFMPLQPVAQPPAAPAPAGALPAPPPPPVSAAKSAKSSLPPLKSPMAGTFYRSPGPGQPPFVKVGDKVNKGQVLCILEAMKLMNEIEADRAGTVIEILVDDAMPVSMDQPLFLIEP